MKKILYPMIAAGLVAGSTVSAVAAPALDRDGSPVAQAENGGASTALLVILFAIGAAALIFAIESGEDADLPTSP